MATQASVDTADLAQSERRVSTPTTIAWVGLGILLLLGFVAFLDRQVVALMVRMIKTDLHIDDTKIGLLQGAAFGLVYPLFAVPLGYAADYYSRRWVIFFGVVLWSVCAMASGLADSYTPLLAARVGVGIGEAALGPAAFSLISDIFPRNRLATVMSIYATGSLLGASAALAIGGAVIHWAGHGLDVPQLGHLAAWQVAFIVTGARTRAEASAAWRDVFTFIRDHWAFLVCYQMGFSCMYLVAWASAAWLPSILERTYGWTILQIGATLGLFTAVVGMTGQLSNGLVVDRMFSRSIFDAHFRYYSIAALVACACGIAAPFAGSAWLYLVAIIPWKFVTNFGGVEGAALQVVTPSHLRGRVSAITGVIGSITGGTLGPSVVAFFTDHVFHNDAKVAWSMALTNAIFLPTAALLFWLGRKPMREAVRRANARIAAAA